MRDQVAESQTVATLWRLRPRVPHSNRMVLWPQPLARIAAVASGVSARDYSMPFDSVWIDFTKGLGAPVGAVLAGSATFITQAWRLKQQMGGAMRQAGIIAAGGIFALRHHVSRLAETM